MVLVVDWEMYGLWTGGWAKGCILVYEVVTWVLLMITLYNKVDDQVQGKYINRQDKHASRQNLCLLYIFLTNLLRS